MDTKRFKELCEKAQSGLMEKMIMSQIKDAPPLPEGWEYAFDFDTRFNYELKCWEVVGTMIPRQKTIVKED